MIQSNVTGHGPQLKIYEMTFSFFPRSFKTLEARPKRVLFQAARCIDLCTIYSILPAKSDSKGRDGSQSCPMMNFWLFFMLICKVVTVAVLRTEKWKGSELDRVRVKFVRVTSPSIEVKLPKNFQGGTERVRSTGRIQCSLGNNQWSETMQDYICGY